MTKNIYTKAVDDAEASDEAFYEWLNAHEFDAFGSTIERTAIHFFLVKSKFYRLP